MSIRFSNLVGLWGAACLALYTTTLLQPSACATMSTVTVPLVAAPGIGLASAIERRNPILDGFGLIALASLTPMIFVQFYGIYVYQFADVVEMAAPITQQLGTSTSTGFEFNIAGMFRGFLNIFFDVLPILAVIFFLQYVVLKKKINNLKDVLINFGLVIVGLYAFVLGLEMGLFTLGETLADARNMKLATVNILESDKRLSFRAHFSAVHVIVPKEKALLAAKKAGATGVPSWALMG